MAEHDWQNADVINDAATCPKCGARWLQGGPPQTPCMPDLAVLGLVELNAENTALLEHALREAYQAGFQAQAAIQAALTAERQNDDDWRRAYEEEIDKLNAIQAALVAALAQLQKVVRDIAERKLCDEDNATCYLSSSPHCGSHHMFLDDDEVLRARAALARVAAGGEP